MKIAHIALYCLHLEEMRQFFVGYFNCISNNLYHNPRTGLKSYILSFPEGETCLEIMSRPEVVTENHEFYRAGFVHMSIAVGSESAVNEKTQELQKNGFECIIGPRMTGDGYYESCVVGPEGILIEITK